MESKTNGIASAADFKQLAEAAAWMEPERIVLPCGLGMILRRPTLMYFRLRRSVWSQDLIQKIEELEIWQAQNLSEDERSLLRRPEIPWPPDLLSRVNAASRLTPEDRALLVREEGEMLRQAIIAPKLSPHPGGDEIHPDWLLEPDKQFIVKFLRGEVLADGTDLETFPGRKPTPAADSGDPGGEVPGEAVEAASEPDARLVN